MNEDIKNVVTNALEEVFEELKDNALDFVENAVFPYVDAAIDDFEAAQTVEAEASTSGWVKIRAKLINTGIDRTNDALGTINKSLIIRTHSQVEIKGLSRKRHIKKRIAINDGFCKHSSFSHDHSSELEGYGE